MTNFLQKYLRRTTIIALLVILQVAVLAFTMVRLSRHYIYVYVAFTLISIVTALWIVSRRDNPSYKLGWILVVLGLPVFGCLFYLLFGGHRVSKKLRYRFRESLPGFMGSLRQTPGPRSYLKEQDANAACQSHYILEHSGYPAWQHTQVEYFPLGEDKFASLLRDLKAARHCIFLEYFIIQPGKMWDPILAILEEKAAEGLDVRVLFDDIGCGYTLPDFYEETLRKKGIKAYPFNPFKPVVSVIFNNRDHRKIAVIDGCIGYTGGINLADEYINEKVRFGHWKDTAVRLEGEAVWNLTAMFLRMWDGVAGTYSDPELLRPCTYHPEPFAGEGIVQPYGDNPIDDEEVGENVYLNMISRAQRYIWITTPYLVADHEVVTALCLAAKSGVDVRIITPGIPDKWYVHMVTQGNYPQLVEAGVKIWEYTPGFMHAKSFVCDDRYAAVGSINLDYRSLYLHFECGVWMYNTPCIPDICKDFLEAQSVSRRIPLDYNRNLSLPKRMLRGVLRLFAPLM